MSSDRRHIPSAAATFADLDGPLDVAPLDEEGLDGRLEEREVLGRGGLGEVVECFDRDLRRVVALKRPLEAGETAATALFREAQVTAQLTHPGIPSVHAVGVGDDGRPWFTMDRLRGRTLRELLDDGLDWTMARRLRVLLAIAQAVEYAHHRGVLHRDLKPENVFVGEFGEIHLVDWGIAKVVGADDPAESVQTTVRGQTAVGVFVGTPAYASPEQLRGDTELDARSDVFSLGAVLHAVLTGRPPVTGDSAETIRERVLAGDIPMPTVADGVPAPLAAILQKTLEVERDDRYATVAELTRDLEAFLDHRSVRAYDEGHLEHLGRIYQQTAPMTRLDVDTLVFVGVCLGGFLTALVLAGWPELAPWIACLAAIGYATVGFTMIRRVMDLWRIDNLLNDRRLLIGRVLIGVGLVSGVAWAFGWLSL